MSTVKHYHHYIHWKISTWRFKSSTKLCSPCVPAEWKTRWDRKIACSYIACRRWQGNEWIQSPWHARLKRGMFNQSKTFTPQQVKVSQNWRFCISLCSWINKSYLNLSCSWLSFFSEPLEATNSAWLDNVLRKGSTTFEQYFIVYHCFEFFVVGRLACFPSFLPSYAVLS